MNTNIFDRSIMELGALVRTEQLTLEQMFALWQAQARQSPHFAYMFSPTVMQRVHTHHHSSLCLGVPFAVTQDIYVAHQGPMAPPADAEAVQHLLENGAVPIGHLKCNPLGMQMADDSVCLSAAKAVAENQVPFALSVDLGGSALSAAAQCGVAALRPTYSLCSRFGILGRAPTLEQVCITAKNARDLALVAQRLFENNKLDSTAYSAQLPSWLEGFAHYDLTRYKLGIASGTRGIAISHGNTMRAAGKAAELYELLGVTIVQEPLPINGTETALLDIIAAGESLIEENLGQRMYDMQQMQNILSRQTPDVRKEVLFKHLLLGKPETLRNAKRLRAALLQAFERTLSNIDALLLSTEYENVADVLSAVSLCGMCALTLPSVTNSTQPLSLLLIGRQFSESTLLALGDAYEKTHRLAKEVHRPR